MINTKIYNWLSSGEYQAQIDSVLTNIIRKCELSNSESNTASIFENEIYFLVRSQTDIEIPFNKEYALGGIVHKFNGLSSRKSGKGRLDAVVNNLLIEYKHHNRLFTKRQITNAFDQVKDYLNAIYQNENEQFDAILTDGIKIAYFSFVGDSIKHTSLHNLSVNDIDRIIRAILNNQTKKFEPSNIIKDFAITSNSPSISRTIAQLLFKQLETSMTEKSNMLFSEWKELMHLSVDDDGKSNDIGRRRQDLSSILLCPIPNPETEYKALFALQTTYAIIVKLIACKIVDKLNFNSDTHTYHDLSSLTSENTQKFFQKMEDGYSYNNMGIRNFLEGDFFSWYSDSEQWSYDFWINIIKIIQEIDNYSSFSLNVSYNPIDVFKDLYMSIIPQSIRHSMGEYFTPEWLADCIISESLLSLKDKNWTAIDPCCGSGIFLIALIKKIVGEKCVNELSVEEKKNY